MGLVTSSAAPRAPSAGPRRLSRRRKLVFMTICVVLFLLLCEGGLRLRAWVKYGAVDNSFTDGMKVHDADLDLMVLRPGYEVRGRDRSLHVNALGFRGAEVTRAKPKDTLRIACLGGSTTFCGEVDDDATWPARLQAHLSAAFPGRTIEVVNAGVPGYVLADCRKVLPRVLDLQPDLVFFYEAHNQLGHDTRPLAAARGIASAGDIGIPAPARFLARYSLLFDLSYKNSKILLANGAGGDKLNGLPDDLAAGYTGELTALRETLRERGVPLVLSTFLVKYRRDQPRDVQVKNADVAFYYMPWMSLDDLLDGIDRYNDAVLAFGTARGVPTVDVRGAVPADRQHFVDCMHLSRAGCDALARHVAEFLKAEGTLRRLAGP